MPEHTERMLFVEMTRFKRKYQCPACGLVAALERNSHGKIPYCTGVANQFVMRLKDDYLAEGRAKDPDFCTHGRRKEAQQ